MRLSLASVILLTVTVILSLFNTIPVEAIKCYECSSAKDVHCSEEINVDNTNLKINDCSYLHNAQFCIKTTGIFNGEMGTTRFCSSENLGNICDFQKRKGDLRAYRGCVFTCKSDGCNDASSLHSVAYVMMLCFIMWLYHTW